MTNAKRIMVCTDCNCSDKPSQAQDPLQCWSRMHVNSHRARRLTGCLSLVLSLAACMNLQLFSSKKLLFTPSASPLTILHHRGVGLRCNRDENLGSKSSEATLRPHRIDFALSTPPHPPLPLITSVNCTSWFEQTKASEGDPPHALNRAPPSPPPSAPAPAPEPPPPPPPHLHKSPKLQNVP